MNTDAPITSRRVHAADGTSLAVQEIAGDESLIVALHGFTGAGSTMLPLLEGVRGTKSAVTIDLIGHGDSDAPDHLEQYSMPSVVDQVLSVIGPRQPLSVHLIGYSMGGRIALSLGARAPWYFASITTISSTPGIEDPIQRAERHDADLALASHLEAVGVDDFIEEWLTNPLFASYVSALDDDGRMATVTQRRASSATGLANSLRGTGTGAMPPVWASLGSIRSPLLAIAGELDDRYVDIANELSQRVLNGRAEVVSGAGHVVHEENLVESTNLVAKFLQSCELIESERVQE